jgi:hypothetical protein
VLVSMRTHGGEEVEKEEARERTMRSPEFGPEEYEEELSVLPPWMTSVGGEGRYAAAWPHLTRDQLVLHTGTDAWDSCNTGTTSHSGDSPRHHGVCMDTTSQGNGG